MIADAAPGPGPSREPAPESLPPFPDGAALRRWTAWRTLRHAAGPWALVGSIYSGLLSLAIVAAMLGPQVGRLVPSDAAGRPVSTLPLLARLDPAWLALALLLLLLSLASGPLRRLGPLFLRPHEAAWWLPLPGGRGGLLAPVARAELAAAAGLGAGVGVILAWLADAGALAALAWALAGGAGVAGMVLALMAAQLHHRPGWTVPAVLTAAATACVLASATIPFPRGAGVGSLVPTAAGVVAVLGLAAAWRVVRSRLGTLPDAELLEVVARSFGAHVSLLSMDTRAIGRLLAPAARAPRTVSSLPLARCSRLLPRAARPVAVVAQADWLLLRRRPRHLLQVVVGLGLALLPVLGGVEGWVRVSAYLAGAWVAVLALAAPARQAWFDGGVDAAWPVAPVLVRLGHLVIPAVVMTAWTALALVPFLPTLTGAASVTAAGQTITVSGSWWAAAGLVLLTGWGWGGAALRSGFRVSPDFSAGLVTSPMGSLPPGAVQMLLSGPDAAVVAGATTALLTLGGPATPFALAVQAVAGVVVVAWGLLAGRKA